MSRKNNRKKNREELCELKSQFQSNRKNLERQITALKEKYKKEKRDAKSRGKKIKQAQKDTKVLREHLLHTLPERRQEEFRIAFLKEHYPGVVREQEEGEEDELDRAI